MKVFLTGHHAHVGVFGKPELRLSDFLVSSGWQLTEDPEIADAICAIEVPAKRFGGLTIPQGALDKGLLVIQEPDVVWPPNSDQKAKDSFASVFEVGRPKSGIKWPLVWVPSRGNFSESGKEERACMIAGAKMSFISGELYSLRREVLQKDPRIDLYGAGWRKSVLARAKEIAYQLMVQVTSGKPLSRNAVSLYFKTPKRYFGPIDDKIMVNARYKASVVIENSGSYMSEKLLEAIVSGSIPVYVGPDPSDFGIPSNLYILARPTSQSVADGVSLALEMDYTSWARDALSFLSSSSISEEWSLLSHWNYIDCELKKLVRSTS